MAGLAEDLHRLCAGPVSHSDKEDPMHWCGDMGMFRITGLQIMSLNAHGQAGRQAGKSVLLQYCTKHTHNNKSNLSVRSRTLGDILPLRRVLWMQKMGRGRGMADMFSGG